MPYKDRAKSRKSRRRPPVLCICGCGQVRRFAQGHAHRTYRPNGWNAHEPSWYLERERRRA